MKTKNQIAERTAYALGDPTNHMLLENIKFSLDNWRALFIRRDVAANGMSDSYLQKFHIELEKVDKVDDCNFTVDCTILRSKTLIPTPIRLKSDVTFKFVGDVYGKPFAYSEFEEIDFRLHNKYTSGEIFYTLINNRLYFFNATKLKRAGIQHIFEDPYEVNTCATADTCFRDDMDYPMPADLIASFIPSILSGEFKIMPKDTSEVTIDENRE